MIRIRLVIRFGISDHLSERTQFAVSASSDFSSRDRGMVAANPSCARSRSIFE
jgi:hypothetical protein